MNDNSNEITIDADEIIDDILDLSYENTGQQGLELNNKENENSMTILLKSISTTFSDEEKSGIFLKKLIAITTLIILGVLIAVASTIVVCQGIGIMHLEQWTLNLFIVSVLVEFIGIVKIIVSSLFPKDDRKVYLDFIKECASRKNNKD